MEMVIALAAFVVSVIALACVASIVVWLLMMSVPKEDDDAESVPLPTTADDVEKRRRQAVQAAHHRNFMDYDGSPQKPVDPNTILADGG